MKTIKIMLSLLLLASAATLNAQMHGLQPVFRQLEVAYSKTTTLVFPFQVINVDRGSQDILAQKAKGTDNVVQVKAAQQDFEDTNLTVITSDGQLYCFSLCYNEFPEAAAFTFASGKEQGTISFSGGQHDAQEIASFSEMALHEKRGKANVSESAYGIRLEITGLYIHGDLIYYRVMVINATPISYDIGGLRFFVRDQKRSKRTASQEVEILPMSAHPEVNKIAAFSQALVVYALPKFTIPDKKKLIVELTEASGGRHLQLKLSNKKAAKVVALPNFN